MWHGDGTNPHSKGIMKCARYKPVSYSSPHNKPIEGWRVNRVSSSRIINLSSVPLICLEHSVRFNNPLTLVKARELFFFSVPYADWIIPVLNSVIGTRCCPEPPLFSSPLNWQFKCRTLDWFGRMYFPVNEYCTHCGKMKWKWKVENFDHDGWALMCGTLHAPATTLLRFTDRFF